MSQATIPMPSLRTVAPTADAPPVRRAFRRYAAEVLAEVTGIAELAYRGTTVRVNGFRLRSHYETAPAQELPARPVPAGPVTTTGPDGLLTVVLRALLRVTVPRVDGRPCRSARWSGGTERGSWSVPEEDTGDFVFAFPVPPADSTASPSVEPAALTAAVLWALLDTVDLLHDGQQVMVDEIAVDGRRMRLPEAYWTSPDLGSRKEIPGSGVQPLHTVAATEPTIVTIARHWSLLAALLSVTPLATTGMPELTLTDGAGPAVEGHRIGAFELRDLSGWLVDTDCHPSEIYEYLARVCNVACKFCYLFGNPDDLAVARGKKVIADDEMTTRLKYFLPKSRRMLFKSQWEINEFLVDPKLPQVLRELRAKSKEEFYFITNGSPLLPRVIDLLDEVRPVTLIVSTNTIDAPLRAQVMNERRKQTETALSCLERLAERRIPFGLSFVATPEFPAAKLAEAIEKIEPLRPAMVRVNLPGFTRDHPYLLPFDTETVWTQATREVAALRSRFTTPIVIIPSAFEANLLLDDPHEPRITGTVPGSPAARAGFQPGDLVERVGFLPVASRAEVQSLVMMLDRPTPIAVRRGGESISVVLDPGAPTEYPYTGHLIGKYVVPHGLVVAPSLSRGDAGAVAAAIDSAGARSPWLVTSPLMITQARFFAERWLPEHAEKLHYVVARNEYLGGNIQVLDMATVGDIYQAVSREKELTGTQPDLLLVPGTGFNRQGRDVAGRHWADLRRALGVPVKLLDVTTQFLF